MQTEAQPKQNLAKQLAENALDQLADRSRMRQKRNADQLPSGITANRGSSLPILPCVVC